MKLLKYLNLQWARAAKCNALRCAAACVLSVCGAWEKPDFSCVWGTAERSSPSHRRADLQYHTWNMRSQCVRCLFDKETSWRFDRALFTLTALCGWVWVNTNKGSCSGSATRDAACCRNFHCNNDSILVWFRLYRKQLLHTTWVFRSHTVTLFLCICFLNEDRFQKNYPCCATFCSKIKGLRQWQVCCVMHDSVEHVDMC